MYSCSTFLLANEEGERPWNKKEREQEKKKGKGKEKETKMDHFAL